MDFDSLDHLWHYLDNFFVAGRPGMDECHSNLLTMLRVCEILGIPLADDKLAAMYIYIYILAILGIESNSQSSASLRRNYSA